MSEETPANPSTPPPTPMNQRSIWAVMSDEVNQAPPARQALIRKLEGIFKGFTVITYFTSFDSETGVIADADAEVMEEMLACRPVKGPVMLIIDSPGGDAMAAERIANVCRQYSGGEFEVIVPHMAKSAATMICFGASKIHMGPTGELGPVDPQIPQHSDRGGLLWISADEILRSYDTLMETAGKDPNVLRVEPYLQQLQRYDSRRIEQIRSARKLSRDISIKLLQGSQMKGVSESDIEAKIKIFLQQEHMSAHGRRIGLDEAQVCGLKIQGLELDSETWKTIWALYRRSSYRVSGTEDTVKLMETGTDSVYA
jgi:hypothetical protein